MSIIVQQMQLYTVLLYFLQTALHLSEETLNDYQEYIQTVITTSGTGLTAIAVRPVPDVIITV